MKKLFTTIIAICALNGLSLRANVHVDTALVVNSVRHNLLLSIPDDYDPGQQYPLVIGIQRCGGASTEFRDSLHLVVDSLKIIVACPDYSGGVVPDADINLYRIVVDSVRSAYNIDTTKVYATAMSCNSKYLLKTALKGAYPFKGIFPWAPYIFSVSPNEFNMNSKLPTVISGGSMDASYKYDIDLYDSLKHHGGNVNLIIEPGIQHTLEFNDVSYMMVKSLYYLNDTNAITISPINDISITSDQSKDVQFQVTNNTGNDINITAMSTYPDYVPNPDVTVGDAGNVTLHIASPDPAGSASVLIIVEAAEVNGGAIEQQTFRVKITKLVSSVKENHSDHITVYPNPVNNQLVVKSDMTGAIVRITDITGKVYYNSKFTGPQDIINVENYARGMYFIELAGKGYVQISKFIKQ